jgi:hypothetical protein
VIDHIGQALEEAVECDRISGVEGGAALRAEFVSSPMEGVSVAPSQNDVGPFGPGLASRFEPDAGAAADDHDRLSG